MCSQEGQVSFPGLGAQKGTGSVETEAPRRRVLVGGSLVLALGEGLPRPTRVEELGAVRQLRRGLRMPRSVRWSLAPAVLRLSNLRNCSEILSAALAVRPVISPWHVCKC